MNHRAPIKPAVRVVITIQEQGRGIAHLGGHTSGRSSTGQRSPAPSGTACPDGRGDLAGLPGPVELIGSYRAAVPWWTGSLSICHSGNPDKSRRLSILVCLEKAAPQTRIAAEVTAIAVSPAAALVSSTAPWFHVAAPGDWPNHRCASPRFAHAASAGFHQDSGSEARNGHSSHAPRRPGKDPTLRPQSPDE